MYTLGNSCGDFVLHGKSAVVLRQHSKMLKAPMVPVLEEKVFGRWNSGRLDSICAIAKQEQTGTFEVLAFESEAVV